jgi:hypothetical protein
MRERGNSLSIGYPSSRDWRARQSNILWCCMTLPRAMYCSHKWLMDTMSKMQSQPWLSELLLGLVQGSCKVSFVWWMQGNGYYSIINFHKVSCFWWPRGLVIMSAQFKWVPILAMFKNPFLIWSLKWCHSSAMYLVLTLDVSWWESTMHTSLSSETWVAVKVGIFVTLKI